MLAHFAAAATSIMSSTRLMNKVKSSFGPKGSDNSLSKDLMPV